MVLTLQSVDDNASAIIQQMGFEPIPHNHHDIRVRLQRTDDVQKILNAMQQGGATFRGLDVRKPNLEEVFLRLTGEALHHDPAGAGGAE
jgi:ABC-2 type transport system ATP-binding protein